MQYTLVGWIKAKRTKPVSGDAVPLALPNVRCLCVLQVAGDPFGPGNLALGLQKGSRLTAPLDQAMIELRTNGFVDVLRHQWLPADFCKSADQAV